jgi:type I restriction enzyme R subunit
VRKYLKETDARIVIDGMLRQAGWEPADKSQVLTEIAVYGQGGEKQGSMVKEGSSCCC